MHNYIIFGLVIFFTYSNLSLLGMEDISLSIPQHILNDKTNIAGFRLGRKYATSYGDIGESSLGEKIFTPACKSKVFTIIDCGPKEQTPYCHTSMLDLNTGIDTPYEILPMRATACHLLNAQTPIVGYHKLFFLQETFNVIRGIKNIYEQPRMYTLEITQTLEPFLAQENQTPHEDVHISTIDSCDTNLLAIASNGFITSWEKNGTKIND